MSEIGRVVNLPFSESEKHRMDAFMVINSRALSNFRDFLSIRGYIEVPETSLIELTESCGSNTKQSQAVKDRSLKCCQSQLDALTKCFERSYFTVSSNEAALKENTERPIQRAHSIKLEVSTLFKASIVENAIERMLNTMEECIKFSVSSLLEEHHHELYTLGSDLNYLFRIKRNPFIRINYNEAIELLNEDAKDKYQYGQCIGIREEREIAAHFCNLPVFLSTPKEKLINGKVEYTDSEDSQVSLLLPKLGLSAKCYAFESKDAQKISAFHSQEKLALGSHCRIFSRPEVDMQAGFKIFFDRFIGFLLGTTLF
jgi:aspartyl/asparaginyl-tRNA synthetase